MEDLFRPERTAIMAFLSWDEIRLARPKRDVEGADLVQRVMRGLVLLLGIALLLSLTGCQPQPISDAGTLIDAGVGEPDGGRDGGSSADLTPPAGSVLIQNGAASTDSEFVAIALSATDDVGVTGYALSNNAIQPTLGDARWESVASAKNMSMILRQNLGSGDGTKTVKAWFRDAAGNVSSASDAITYTKNETWKNWFAVTWTGTPQNNIRYARQMGYDLFAIQGGRVVNNAFYDDYRDNPNVDGMKFYVLGHNSALTHSRTIGSGTLRSDQIAWYNNNMTWARNEPFPRNLASGWWYSDGRFSVVFDYQQQEVIDRVVDKLMRSFHDYQKSVRPGVEFYGYMLDVPHLAGDFNNFCATCASSNEATDLKDMTGRSVNSGILHPKYDDDGGVIGQITHEYATYEAGQAAFYKKLNGRMRQDFPNAKWIVEPSALYSQSLTNEYIYSTMKFIQDTHGSREDIDQLTPDFLSSEGPNSNFVDESRNFDAGMNITRDRVGMSSANSNFYDESVARLLAAKAGVNWAWNNWFGRWHSDTTNTTVRFASIEELYPRLKLIRVISNWDNLRNIPLVNRSWNQSLSTYQSRVNNSDPAPTSYFDANVMYSRHWKQPNKIFGNRSRRSARMMCAISASDGA